MCIQGTRGFIKEGRGGLIRKIGGVILENRASHIGERACLGDWCSRKDEGSRLKKSGEGPRIDKSERLILEGNEEKAPEI